MKTGPSKFTGCAMKLTNTTLGKEFEKINFDKLCDSDYLHISMAVITNSPAKKVNSECEQILNKAIKKLKDVKTFETGRVTVNERGYVFLEFSSPQIKKGRHAE